MSGSVVVNHLPYYSNLLFNRTFTITKAKGFYTLPRFKIYSSYKQMQTTTYDVVNASYLQKTSHINHQNKTKDTSPAPAPAPAPVALDTVGAFQKLPMVMPSVDIYYSALRKARRVSPTKGIANAAKREKNKGAKQLDALMKELTLPLKTYKENFPNKRHLHPYERSLIELTLGDGNYEEVLGKVDSLRKKLVSVGKEHASLCAQSSTKREAEERLAEGIKKLEEIFHSDGKAVDELMQIAKVW